MLKISVKTTKKDEILDITDLVNQKISENNFKQGLCCLNALHTTVALTTADLDPGTDLDLLDAFRAIIPKLNYRHPHNPSHVPDHILSTLIGTSIVLPIKENKLELGTWQRVILAEFNGPQERDIIITFIKS